MNTQTQLLTVADLADMFDVRHGARFITLVAQTTPKLSKGAPNVVKVSRVNACVWFNYQNSVNNQRTREGLEADFKPQPRKWGIRLSDSALVEHNGEYYLEVKIEKSLEHKYFDPNTGAEIAASEVEPFMPQRKEGARQEVENVIILRDYKLSNIQSLTHEGVTYTIAKLAYVPMGK